MLQTVWDRFENSEILYVTILSRRSHIFDIPRWGSRDTIDAIDFRANDRDDRCSPSLIGKFDDRSTSDAKHPHASRRLEGWTRVGGSRGWIVRMRHKQTVKKKPIYRVGDSSSLWCIQVDDIIIYNGLER